MKSELCKSQRPARLASKLGYSKPQQMFAHILPHQKQTLVATPNAILVHRLNIFGSSTNRV
jgi:hypothetical protein